MFRLLHFADLHLDASFASSHLPATSGNWRRSDLRATLGRILTLAREHQVDVVTIAGDLYEQDYALPETADFLAQQFEKLAPTRVFIAPGERDPYTSDSLYALTRWPQNVVVFSEGKLNAHELAPSIHLWGAACPPARDHENLARFHVDRKGVNLLLLHAADAERGPSVKGSVFSVSLSGIHNAGFDLALLGHDHTGRAWAQGTSQCIYPGSPEPLAPKEADSAHQVVLLTVADWICAPELIPINQWCYRSLRIDLTSQISLQDAAQEIERTVQGLPGGDDERLICNITLTGSPPFDLDLEALAENVTSKAQLRCRTRLSLAYNLDQLAQEQTIRGMLVQRFQARLQNAANERERKTALNALSYALQALDGRQIYPYEID